MCWNPGMLIMVVGCVVVAACSGRQTEMEVIKRDHAAIAALLDKALVEPDPLQAFERALPTVRSFASVDSAWISGSTFFVAYKGGGKVTWMIPPPQP